MEPIFKLVSNFFSTVIGFLSAAPMLFFGLSWESFLMALLGVFVGACMRPETSFKQELAVSLCIGFVASCLGALASHKWPGLPSPPLLGVFGWAASYKREPLLKALDKFIDKKAEGDSYDRFNHF